MDSNRDDARGDANKMDAERDLEVEMHQRRTVFHGAIVFALGLAAGVPYTGVILRDHAKDWSQAEQDSIKGLVAKMVAKTVGTERAWKMAHMEGLLNGLAMMLVASLMPILKGISIREIRTLSLAVSINGYGNVLASIICALSSVRGMAAAGSLANRAANLGFGVALNCITYTVYLLLKGSSV